MASALVRHFDRKRHSIIVPSERRNLLLAWAARKLQAEKRLSPFRDRNSIAFVSLLPVAPVEMTLN